MHFVVVMRGRLHKRYSGVGFGFINAIGQLLADVHKTEVEAIKYDGSVAVAKEKYKPAINGRKLG